MGRTNEARVLSRDPETGITELWYYEEERDGFRIETIQEVDPVLESNKAEFALKKKHDRYGDVEHVARIPMVLFDELQRKGITRDQKAFKAWLNDPDNRLFRTRPGEL